jgi:hypothetical protein
LLTSNKPKSAAAQFLAGSSPVGILAGTYTLGFFGWHVSINTLLTVFLQEPEKLGGYSFSPQQNAACEYYFCNQSAASSSDSPWF